MVAKYVPSVVAVLALMVGYQLSGIGQQLWPVVDAEPESPSEYDYVIVGAGTTGAVLASRMASAQSNVTVLLLEAGSAPSNVYSDYRTPILSEVLRHGKLDWGHTTTPQKRACKSLEAQKAKLDCGRGLGGSSNTNNMLYLRGSRHDYDEWAQSGATGWSFRDLLPYFIKSEDNRNNEMTQTIFHGHGGRITVTDAVTSPLTSILKKSFEELGVKKRDVNGANQFGFSQSQATAWKGERWTVVEGYLSRAMLLDNLRVLTEAHVQKLVFHKKVATGVTYKKNDQLHTVKARQEVILSAGTVGSAKLLLVSGVGPRQQLKSLKIPLVADLPVGENLQDHVVGGTVDFFTPHSLSVTISKAESLLSTWKYSLFGLGMKASPDGREGIAYVRTRYQPAHVKYPLVSLQAVAKVPPFWRESVRIKESAFAALYNNVPKEGFSIFPVLLHPKSRGTVRLQSSNPEQEPLINPNYLSEEADVKVLVEAVKFARKLVGTAEMKNWKVTASDRLLQECARKGNFTDSYIDCFVRHLTLPGQNMVGTCRMGSKSDPSAVVDSNLRVRGLRKLRVADASIIPNAISGNNFATQVVIGEKASDLVLGINSIHLIQDYFKQLIQSNHEQEEKNRRKNSDDDDDENDDDGDDDGDDVKKAKPSGNKKKSIKNKKGRKA